MILEVRLTAKIADLHSKDFVGWGQSEVLMHWKTGFGCVDVQTKLEARLIAE